MNKKLYVSPAPLVTNGLPTSLMMIAMIVALVPSAVMGVINYGWKALFIMLISVASSYVFEQIFNLLAKKKFFWYDYSSIVTGLMTALVLPVGVPYYIPVIGAFLATVVFKCFFGGVGRNIFNPTAAARVVLAFVFSSLSLAWFKGTAIGANVTSPLEYFAVNNYSAIPIRSLFFGSVPGAIGTTCMIGIVVMGILLMCFKVTDYYVPATALIAFVAAVWIGRGAIAIVPFLFSGSFMFATFFMVTDPTSSPCTVWGKFVYGILFGIFAGLFRNLNVLGETSVFVAILMVNTLAPLLDKIFVPRPVRAKRRV